MASTYSPALRLELMATGDQSGTWGDTTNTNLGTLLEQAITGYLSVAQGDVANLTLTTVNGGTDQARNAVVEITGALTATRNVVVQTAEKLYTIKNSTTGGFSIVAKTSGGTGISVPPGASIDCYSDGTNVVTGQNYWNGQIGGAVYLDAGAAVGPIHDLFRDSTSPAVSDILGKVVFNGRDSAGNKQEYASIETSILDPTSASEDGTLDHYAVVAGTRTRILSIGPNLDLAAVGQVKFPASQNPSSDANTLDDYDEATTTPAVVSSSGTITTVTCSIATVKIGKRVFCSYTITVTTNGTGSGGLKIPLPFAASPSTSVGGSGINATTGAPDTVGPFDANFAFLVKYDGTYPAASGDTLNGAFSYQASA